MQQADTSSEDHTREGASPDDMASPVAAPAPEPTFQRRLSPLLYRALVDSLTKPRIGIFSVRWLFMAAEVLIILAWTIALTSPYLNLDRDIVPSGREFLHHIHGHHIWGRALNCGQCALWNGSVRGGYPALVDPQSSALHPLVMLTTLGWGVINGSKLSLVGAFLMAGLAQWWLGRVVGVGHVAAVWGGCMAVAGGHLAGRMEHGLFPLVISTAACSLVFPPLILLARSGSRRAAVLLGLTLALALIAGQGYLQITLAFLLPAALLMIRFDREHLSLMFRRFALAGVLALLLAAPFLVPFAHFLPEFSKLADTGLPAAQPLAFVPLNLVINDASFFQSDILHKYPYTSIYVIFVGWIPVLLAVVALRGSWHWWGRGVIAFLLAAMLLAFLLASALPLFWLMALFPALTPSLEGLRFIPLASILAVPPLLTLSMIGLQQVLDWPWPRFRLELPQREQQAAENLPCISTRWLMAVPLVLALTTAQSFGSQWIATNEIEPLLYEEIELLRTPDLQWVGTPYAGQFWVQPSIGRGLKLSEGTQVWYWANREIPMPVRFAFYVGDGEGMTSYGELPAGSRLLKQSGELLIYDAPPGAEYAAVVHPDGRRTICQAYGTGGDINVRCDLPEKGILTVKENNWTGWQSTTARGPLSIGSGQWLTVELAAGEQTVRFRYRPWDAWIGIGLWLAGVAAAWYNWEASQHETAW